MIKVLSVNDMRESDKIKCDEVSSLYLMYTAGSKVFESFDFKGNVLIVCGSGNNAGDGYVLAPLLKAKGVNVTILLTSDKFSKDGQYYYDICVKNDLDIVRYTDEFSFEGYDYIVDCIVGTGYKDNLSGIYYDIVNKINNSNSYIISIDINSGLNGDTGMTKMAVKSDLTMSIGYYKPGHFLNMAKDYIKDKINLDIDIEAINSYYLFEEKDAKDIFKRRNNFSNKGDYGYVALIGGSLEYSGAIRLADMATTSIVSGAGVSIVGCPKRIADIVASNILEATIYPFDDNDGHILFNEEKLNYLMKRCKAISIGMGIGISDDAKKILKYLINNYDKRLIIDADGLNMLSSIKEELRNTKAKIVLTPHIKEFSRLIGRDIDDIFNNIIDYSMDFAKEYNVTLLLKGPTTIITDGEDVILVDRGTPGMATAGSGDVLSGIITGILGYGDDILKSVALAAYINGLSGEVAEKKNSYISMSAKDTVESIKYVINEIVNNLE